VRIQVGEKFLKRPLHDAGQPAAAIECAVRLTAQAFHDRQVVFHVTYHGAQGDVIWRLG